MQDSGQSLLLVRRCPERSVKIWTITSDRKRTLTLTESVGDNITMADTQTPTRLGGLAGRSMGAELVSCEIYWRLTPLSREGGCERGKM